MPVTYHTIERYRGDTYANIFQIKDSNGDPIDITNYTFKMTVNTERYPQSESTQLYQIVGVLVSPLSGTVKFAPNATQADQDPGTYYFDVQMTDDQGLSRRWPWVNCDSIRTSRRHNAILLTLTNTVNRTTF